MIRNIPALILTFAAMTAVAQYGTAPNNYYPSSYHGSTFTGTVTASTAELLTLTYTKGTKTDTFAGRFERACSVPSATGKKMTPADIPNGTVMTAFFNRVTEKVNNQKMKENKIIAIAFEVWNGEAVNQDKKMIYTCAEDTHLQFMAW